MRSPGMRSRLVLKKPPAKLKRPEVTPSGKHAQNKRQQAKKQKANNNNNISAIVDANVCPQKQSHSITATAMATATAIVPVAKKAKSTIPPALKQ